MCLAWLPILCRPAPAAEVDALGAEQALVELDWRKQDGIDTPRNPNTYRAASEQLLRRGDALLRDLEASGTLLAPEASQWQELQRTVGTRYRSRSRALTSRNGKPSGGDCIACVGESP